jgi:tetratricopeptide (TPR) repeat protein
MGRLTGLFRGPETAEAPKTAGLSDYEAAVNTNPNDPQAWYNLGAYYRVQGDPYKAAEALQRAVSLRPDFPDARYMLGLAYADQGQVEKAVKLFEEVSKVAKNRMLQDYARRKIQELRGAGESG